MKPSENAVLFGKMDGSGWQELRRAKLPIDTSQKQRLSVTGIGDRFSVHLNGAPVLTLSDPTYQSGTVGLRSVDIPATFSNLEITSPGI